MDFDGEWVPFIRDNVDLMVLPHRQGDPSGTYLEAAGLGVPTLGFDNEAFRALVAHEDLGWAVPNGNGRLLLEKALQLVENPAELRKKSINGLTFMNKHHCDHEFAARIQHLEAIAAG